MNQLEQYITDHSLDEVKVMNELQDNGIISDLAVMVDGVAGADTDEAIRFIKKRLTE